MAIMLRFLGLETIHSRVAANETVKRTYLILRAVGTATVRSGNLVRR